MGVDRSSEGDDIDDDLFRQLPAVTTNTGPLLEELPRSACSSFLTSNDTFRTTLDHMAMKDQ